MKTGREVALLFASKYRKDLEDRRDKLERKQPDVDTWMVRGEINYIRGKIDEIEASISKGEF